MGSYEGDEAYGIQRAPIGKFSIERGTADRRTEPFIGATERQQRRRFAVQLLRVAGEPASRAADTGVRVYVIDPGDMNTAMHRLAEPGVDLSNLPDPAMAAPAFVEIVERGSRPFARVQAQAAN